MKPRIYKMEDRWWLEWDRGVLTFGSWEDAVKACQMPYLEYVPVERKGILERILFRLYPMECIVAKN